MESAWEVSKRENSRVAEGGAGILELLLLVRLR
jgi:hypothetical protein